MKISLVDKTKETPEIKAWLKEFNHALVGIMKTPKMIDLQKQGHDWMISEWLLKGSFPTSKEITAWVNERMKSGAETPRNFTRKV